MHDLDKIFLSRFIFKKKEVKRMFGYLNLLAGGRFPADAGHRTGNHISVVLVGPYTGKKIIICQCLFAVISIFTKNYKTIK
jgi:hypothetical protein